MLTYAEVLQPRGIAARRTAQLHLNNVRLYASKMRTEAKMGSLAADLEMLKKVE